VAESSTLANRSRNLSPSGSPDGLFCFCEGSARRNCHKESSLSPQNSRAVFALLVEGQNALHNQKGENAMNKAIESVRVKTQVTGGGRGAGSGGGAGYRPVAVKTHVTVGVSSYTVGGSGAQ
jgi:hypothetical protein